MVLTSRSLQPNDTPQGKQTLDDFVGGTDVVVAISGYSQSTGVASLLEAFESLNLTAKLPALKSKLLQSASLVVLPTTGHSDDIAHTTVSLANPFSADLLITSVKSSVTFHGLTLGTIDQQVQFASKGKSTTNSPDLNLNMNMDPQTLFTVTRVLAQEAGLNTAQLDAIVQLGGYQYLNNLTSRAVEFEKRDNMFTYVVFLSARGVDRGVCCMLTYAWDMCTVASTSRPTWTRRSQS